MKVLINDDFITAFNPLWEDIVRSDTFPEKRPLLAHYTSIEILECIMANDEVWFSNPLYMNDIEELRFGMNQGWLAFRSDNHIKAACGDERRYQLLLESFDHYYQEFDEKHAFDTYVICFAEHDLEHSDGLLSMWRSYGGNGKGAAIVFDTAKLNVHEGSPFIVSKVRYLSREMRLKWIQEKMSQFARLLEANQIQDDKLYIAAHALLERIKTYAIFTKHRGFHEEREWRVAYLSQRDTGNWLKSMLHYSIGSRGLEPRLKLKIKPIPGLTADDFSLEKLVSQIILGPSVATPLAIKSVHRMLDILGKGALCSKVIASTTPFRPTS